MVILSVLCIGVITITYAGEVHQHVLLADESSSDGTVFSYSNKAEIDGGTATILGEMVSVPATYKARVSDTFVTADQLKTYENEEIVAMEKELDDPNTEAGKLYANIDVKLDAPEAVAVSSLQSLWLKRIDVCPERKYILRYYWEAKGRICRVVRPYHQYVSYVRCSYQSCCKSENRSICLPSGWTRRAAVVVCYNTSFPWDPKWAVKIFSFPQCCDCHALGYATKG